MDTQNSEQQTVPGEGKVFANLLWDSGFKAVLADPDNKELLIELLNILLPEYVRVKDIKQYRDREKRTDFDGAKKTVLDLSCEGVRTDPSSMSRCSASWESSSSSA